jgi:hypothetical protein
MDEHASTVMLLPSQGDYAAGARTSPEARVVRGTFATGQNAAGAPRLRHHGDFAAGLRLHLHMHRRRWPDGLSPAVNWGVATRSQPPKATTRGTFTRTCRCR